MKECCLAQPRALILPPLLSIAPPYRILHARELFQPATSTFFVTQPSVKPKMLLEDQRFLHEDLERLEQAITDRVAEDPKNVSAALSTA